MGEHLVLGFYLSLGFAGRVRRLSVRAWMHVKSHGNVLAAVAYLHGLTAHELSRAELDVHDPLYQLVITARAMKRRQRVILGAAFRVETPGSTAPSAKWRGDPAVPPRGQAGSGSVGPRRLTGNSSRRRASGGARSPEGGLAASL